MKFAAYIKNNSLEKADFFIKRQEIKSVIVQKSTNVEPPNICSIIVKRKPFSSVCLRAIVWTVPRWTKSEEGIRTRPSFCK